MIYLVDATSGAYPWILQRNGAPEQITYDKNDHTYKDAGKIGMKFVLKMAAKAALPHACERITITG